jgi:hypothetical protein
MNSRSRDDRAWYSLRPALKARVPVCSSCQFTIEAIRTNLGFSIASMIAEENLVDGEVVV